jgi:hypothetical protein
MKVSRNVAWAVLAAVPVAVWLVLQTSEPDNSPDPAAAAVAGPRIGTVRVAEGFRTERSTGTGRQGRSDSPSAGDSAVDGMAGISNRGHTGQSRPTTFGSKSANTAPRSAGWAAPDLYPQPAVWVEIGDLSDLAPLQQEEIQSAAEELVEKIVASDPDPSSPGYQQAWAEAVADSDRLFRQRYGARLWSLHHIEAHHLARTSGSE